MDGAGKGQRCLGTMEHRAFLPRGKTKHRLSIVTTGRLSELDGIFGAIFLRSPDLEAVFRSTNFSWAFLLEKEPN